MNGSRQRVRDLGVHIGEHAPGLHNAITDVPGIRVGHTTLHLDPHIHTGVSAVLPAHLPVPAGLFVGNGYGKLVGATQLQELGEIETPILLTSTLSAFRVADALVTWLLKQPGFERVHSLNPVVGETNDGYLSDIRARPLTEEHVLHALESASSGMVAEGCVGAGSGTCALGFKGGIGTSSRVVSSDLMQLGKEHGSSVEKADTCAATYTVGALVQANFGGTLSVQGRPITPPPSQSEPEGNSCMIVVATDAPLDSRQLTRVAKRAVFAMGRVGANYAHGSGDYGVAVSTSRARPLADGNLDPLFTATMDAVEEALLNAVFMADTTYGTDGHVRYAVPTDAWRS